MELYREIQENVTAQKQADTKAAEIFAFFDEVSAHTSVPNVGPRVRSWLCTSGC
jgi:hypothetical protein